jgi:ribosomal protein L10
LTKTKKKGATLKKDLITKVREWVDQYDNIFVLQFGKEVKTVKIQEIREQWKPHGRYVNI